MRNGAEEEGSRLIQTAKAKAVATANAGEAAETPDLGDPSGAPDKLAASLGPERAPTTRSRNHAPAYSRQRNRNEGARKTLCASVGGSFLCNPPNLQGPDCPSGAALKQTAVHPDQEDHSATERTQPPGHTSLEKSPENYPE